MTLKRNYFQVCVVHHVKTVHLGTRQEKGAIKRDLGGLEEEEWVEMRTRKCGN